MPRLDDFLVDLHRFPTRTRRDKADQASAGEISLIQETGPLLALFSH
jgi:hypothetical protein